MYNASNNTHDKRPSLLIPPYIIHIVEHLLTCCTTSHIVQHLLTCMLYQELQSSFVVGMYAEYSECATHFVVL